MKGRWRLRPMGRRHWYTWGRDTFIGNEPMESAKDSGQLEGWNQILDKVAEVVAELAQKK